MPGSHATRRRHHKPLHSVCAIADSAGAWRARSSADAGDPPRWVPQMPTWEAPGKRILLFLGRTQVPVVGGQGGNGGGGGIAAALQAGYGWRQLRGVPGLWERTASPGIPPRWQLSTTQVPAQGWYHPWKSRVLSASEIDKGQS